MDSSLGMFSFHPEKLSADISSISLSSRPSAAGVSNTIFSMTLPGKTEGQEVKTETIKIYCNTQAPDKRDQNSKRETKKQYVKRNNLHKLACFFLHLQVVPHFSNRDICFAMFKTIFSHLLMILTTTIHEIVLQG